MLAEQLVDDDLASRRILLEHQGALYLLQRHLVNDLDQTTDGGERFTDAPCVHLRAAAAGRRAEVRGAGSLLA